MRLPVHCCCSPAKRLGYLELPTYLSHHGVKFAVVMRGPVGVWELHSVPERMSSVRIDTEVCELNTLDGAMLAVKSAHRSIEDWRQVAGFTEDQGVV